MELESIAFLTSLLPRATAPLAPAARAGTLQLIMPSSRRLAGLARLCFAPLCAVGVCAFGALAAGCSSDTESGTSALAPSPPEQSAPGNQSVPASSAPAEEPVSGNSPAPSPGSEATPDDLPLGTPTNPPSNTPVMEMSPPASDPQGMTAGTGTEPMPEPPTALDPAQLPSLRVWIAGDSTVANGQTPCPRGWGGAISALFDSRVTINNAAAGGRSVHTWLYQVGQEIDEATRECELARDAAGEPLLQARWQTMLDGMQAGDYLFIQFGINDGDPSCDRHVGLAAFET
ncbi:MAG: hypothetical protein RL685_4394, partial [Pseudomonadota bacterium]